jgi:hypothetical protein
MNNEVMQIINDFNATLLSLAQNVAGICPISIIGNNIKDIEKQIKHKNNLTKFVDIFCIKVLQYKDQIDAGKESFFMDKDYSNDLDAQDRTSDTLNIVLSLKSVWKDFKPENKQIIMLNMQILCDLAQIYYNHISQNFN